MLLIVMSRPQHLETARDSGVLVGMHEIDRNSWRRFEVIKVVANILVRLSSCDIVSFKVLLQVPLRILNYNNIYLPGECRSVVASRGLHIG